MNFIKESGVMVLPKINNFYLRSLTVLLLAPIVIMIVWVGGYWYKFILIIISILMAFEWHSMTNNSGQSKQLFWQLVGVAYITIPIISLLWLRDYDKGREVVLWLLAVVWTTDIGAYIAGKTVGGYKICPAISPNKTWAGLVGGLFGALLVGYLTTKLIYSAKPMYLIIISLMLGAYGQFGDLVESWLKRKFKVKDSGFIIPGHGGILDRVDSLVPVAPKVVLILLFDKWGIF